MQEGLAASTEKDTQQKGCSRFQGLENGTCAAMPCMLFLMTCVVCHRLSDCQLLSVVGPCLQVSEAHLLQFMGGRLGAQAQAVENLMQMLPEVIALLLVPCVPLFDVDTRFFHCLHCVACNLDRMSP